VPYAANDANGNTLSDPTGKSYSWDFENRLTQAVVPGTGTVAFKYDPFGRRIQKSGPLGTTNYLYSGENSVEEVDNNGNVLARYTQSPGIDQPLAELRTGTIGYYQQDGINSITALSNASGSLANTYTYDSFGRLTTSTGTLTNPFQYTGREFDLETGIYEYRARYYDPTVGRFASEDPIGFKSGIDFYTYVRNDPTDLLDPLGLSPTPLPPNRTRWVPCNGFQESQCRQICALQGNSMQSCMMSQTWGVIRWKDGMTVWGWKTGPMSCSCNEPPNNNKCDTCEKVWDWVQERWVEFCRYMGQPHNQPMPGGPPPVFPPIPVAP